MTNLASSTKAPRAKVCILLITHLLHHAHSQHSGWLCKIHVTKPNEVSMHPHRPATYVNHSLTTRVQIEELLDDVQYKELTDH